ncbi:hypothetical protein ABMA28_010526 [Loxostege sticticalis]|uniref:Integrase catalytic domain-containing protein n=1 Tax=Loxostege sticticalis TaxID=481309 RepID=A0ABD0S9J9_LOXSC
MADPDERIDTWLQQNANVPVSTEVNTPGHTTSAFAPPAQEPCIERGERQQYGKLPESVHFEETRRRVLSPTPIRQRGDIEQLAEAIEKMARNRPAPRQVIDLPIFTGAFNEWLPFAAAYKESSTAYNFTDVENLARLRNCLRGEAKEAVAELLCTGGSPEQVMRTLEQCFGRPEFIINKVLDDIKKLPRLGNSARELNTFAVRLQNIVCALKNLGRRGYMEYPMLTRDILEKLTPHLKSRWCDYAHEHDHPSVPEIMVLSRFLMREAELALRYTYAPATTTTVAAKPTATWKSAPRKNKADVYATTASAPNDQYKCYKCEGNHTLVNCDQFKKMNTDERWEVVKNAGLCFKCIVSRHRRMNCRAKPCGENECRRPHHKLLHADPTPTPSSPTVSAPKVVTNETVMSVAAADAEKDAAVLLKVLPVTLTGPKRQIQAHALLDEGATISLIEEELAQQLGVRGPSRPLQINGVTACQRHTRSEAVKISIRGRSQRECHEIKLRTIPQLVLHTQAIPAGILNYEHLRDLDPGNVCYESTRPRLLIGADNWHLIVSRELRTGKKTEPVASRTELGWTVHGTVPRALHRTSEESVLHVFTPERTLSENTESDDHLSKMMEEHFQIDSLGVSMKTKIKPEDQRAIEIFEATAKRSEGRFEVGLPWRSDEPTMPPSYNAAYRRLKNLERRFIRDPAFASRYKEEIDALVTKGYAETCQDTEERSPRKWYLPHFPVFNPNKPGKLRLVFDAAAKSHGLCLNDFLLEGPDLLQPLQGILFRFRENPIAVKADIQEMFLRVKIRKEDQPAQMFLWREDPSKPPQIMKMTSMIFGASSSPFIAHSVRNRNAKDYENTHPVAFKSITRSHYMDDLVESYVDVETARRAIDEVCFVHAQAGFNLRGWNCNVEEVLENVPAELRSAAPTRLMSTPDKTLGLLWDAKKDLLAFNTMLARVPEQVVKSDRTPTKREALSAVMSVYDPLGLLSHFTIRAKIILQNVWRAKLGWDEPLPEAEAEDFKKWLTELKGNIAEIRLPRCYDQNNHERRELHVFCDASEQAYAAVVFWRLVREDGTVNVILAAAKAKVAPLKTQSIPRLELQAAVIGARLADAVITEHEWQPSDTIFWSDSRTVLHWIRQDARRYTPFVAHRLGELAERTKTRQWRWIPTEHNVADDATRLKSRAVTSDDRWFTGPKFLYEPEDSWPREEDLEPALEEETVAVTIERTAATHLPDINRFSSYERLIRATANVLVFIEKLRKKQARLEVQHLEEAERLWMIQSQRESFPTEVEALEKGRRINKSSRLYKLDPKLKEGILKLDGRIRAANVPDPLKEPIILDGRHPFTRLLIKKEHEAAGHANRERVVNDLRQRFWILHLRTTVRKIAKNCAMCRLRKARPQPPIFGDLPAARIDPYHRPFSNCGVDYFGPMMVAIGRRREKRWGALFTCLTTRAVHLELVGSLSTDSAIMAIRRMAARRGWPALMISDNATNFRGADVELRNAYKEWSPALEELGQLHRMTWRFIPPGAPNQGGAWERLVRSVKTALTAVFTEKTPKEEVLQTVLVEAEYSINARPLTHVSVDPNDPEAITPNHFLLGTSTGLPHTGPCQPADRKVWRASQALADEFWRRWIREYLPTLVPRQAAAADDRQLRKGDLVVVVDATLPRNTWPRGVVEEIYPGPDGRVRIADVRTRGGVFRRPTSKLAVLTVGEASTVSAPGGEL